MPTSRSTDELREVYDIHGKAAFDEALNAMIPDAGDGYATLRMSIRHEVLSRPRRSFEIRGTRLDGSLDIKFTEVTK